MNRKTSLNPIRPASPWYERSGYERAALFRDGSAETMGAETLTNGLRDTFMPVQRAARQFCKANGIRIHPVRDVEPPPMCFHPCKDGVMAEVRIADDANVVTGVRSSYRTDHAYVVGIYGLRENVAEGISMYYINGHDYAYWCMEKPVRSGMEIAVEDFDCSDNPCGNGFYFFRSLEAAQEFQKQSLLNLRKEV